VIARKPITVIAVSALSIQFHLIKALRKSASRSTFPSELEKRLSAKILPPLPEPSVDLAAIFPLHRSEIKRVLAGERNEALSFQPSAVS
jgi:site-specific recombinase